MIKTTSLIAAVAGVALAAFATAPPATAASCDQGHQASIASLNGTFYTKQMPTTSAPKFSIGYVQGDTASAIDKAKPVHYAINDAQAKNDPAAITKAALLSISGNKTGVGHGHGIVNVSANNSNVDIGGDGLEVAVYGAKACVLSTALLVADNQTQPKNAAGAASI